MDLELIVNREGLRVRGVKRRSPNFRALRFHLELEEANFRLSSSVPFRVWEERRRYLWRERASETHREKASQAIRPNPFQSKTVMACCLHNFTLGGVVVPSQHRPPADVGMGTKLVSSLTEH